MLELALLPIQTRVEGFTLASVFLLDESDSECRTKIHLAMSPYIFMSL